MWQMAEADWNEETGKAMKTRINHSSPSHE